MCDFCDVYSDPSWLKSRVSVMTYFALVHAVGVVFGH